MHANLDQLERGRWQDPQYHQWIVIEDEEEDEFALDDPVIFKTRTWFDGADPDSYNRATGWASNLYKGGMRWGEQAVGADR